MPEKPTAGADDGAEGAPVAGGADGASASPPSSTTPIDTRVTRRDVASWMSGPSAALGDTGAAERYRGERLGLPESGPGSVAGMGRRVGALIIDWLIAMLIAGVFLNSVPRNVGTLFVFAVMVWIFTVAGGSTIGKRLLGIRTTSLRGPYVDPGRALIRTVLLCLVVPAVIWDADQRGLHDRAAATVVTNLR